ncbi:MAG: prolyl-tRNA synthetase associated domain-containing protein [Dongiaceae bacterium]
MTDPAATTAPASADRLFARLAELGIPSNTVRHPPVFTVDEAKALRGELPGGHIKNLFLRNKKEEMWLVVAAEDRAIDLKVLGERLGAGRLSFGSAERLMKYLGVSPGAVTPFALINDRDRQVKVVIDRILLASDPVNCHPLTNDMTTAIASADLIRFVRACGHEPVLMDLGGGT